MRFHSPSFLHYLQFELPVDIVFFHRNYTVYLFSKTPVQMSFLQRAITDTVIRSIEHPTGALNSTEQKSVLKTPLPTHVEALKHTLLACETYLKKYRQRDDRGGGEVRYEYHLDLKEILRIVQAVRLQEDVKLLRGYLSGDYYTSLRLLAQKIYYQTGRVFSLKRLTKAVECLISEGVLEDDGKLRTRGRRVLAWE